MEGREIEVVGKEVEEFIKEITSEEWDIESKILEGSFEITAKYVGSDGVEEIYVEGYLDGYGFPKYRVHIVMADRDDEITSCLSCHDCVGEDCPLYGKDHHEIENMVNKEIEEWKSIEPMIVDVFGNHVEISRDIVDVKCYVDIPHYHLLKGYVISVETHNIDVIKAVITLRYILVDMFEKSLSN